MAFAEQPGTSSKDAMMKRNSSEAFQYSNDGVEKADQDSPTTKSREMTDSAAVGSEAGEPSIDELLAEADARSQRHLEAELEDSDLAETWNLDAAQELLAPEEVFSSEDLEGKT